METPAEEGLEPSLSEDQPSRYIPKRPVQTRGSKPKTEPPTQTGPGSTKETTPTPEATDEAEDENYSEFSDDVEQLKTGITPGVEAEEADEYTENEEDGDDTIVSETEAAQAVFRAIYHGNLHQVQKLRRTEGLEANIADKHGWTMLHWAVVSGEKDIVQYCFDENVPCNAKEFTNGWTALHVAVVRERVGIARLLLKNNVKKEILDHHEDTPLDCCGGTSEKTQAKLRKWLGN